MIKSTFAIASLTVAVLAGSASASTLTLTFNSVSPFKTLKVNYNSGRSFDQDAGSFSDYASGRMNWTDQFNRSVSTYCTQLVEYIGYGQTVQYGMTTVESVPDPDPGVMGPARGKLMRDLYAKHYADVKNSNDANKNAAFQLAIWEITHENVTALDADGIKDQLDVFTGALAANELNGATATVGDLANALIASLGNGGYEDFGGSLIGLTSGQYQDQIIVVPLPFTAGLAGLGLIGAAALRRRFR